MNAKKFAALLVPIALFAGACAEPTTVTKGSTPVSVASTSPTKTPPTTATSTKATPTTTTSSSNGFDSGSYVSGDEASEILTLDDAAMATFKKVGVSCPSEDVCLNAVAAACMFQSMGYDSQDLYAEIAMSPGEKIFDGLPNSAVPHVFGVANGGYCY